MCIRDRPSSALREPSLSSAVFSFLAASAAASPVKSVCLEAVVFPASGEIDVSGVSYTILFGEIPVVSQIIWSCTVPIPCPMQAAEEVKCTIPSFIVIRHLPVSGMPTRCV